jgi:hypothetical protein
MTLRFAASVDTVQRFEAKARTLLAQTGEYQNGRLHPTSEG